MMNSFSNKNVLISGGSSGIGFALAKKFTSLGSNVYILARDNTKLLESKISADVGDFAGLQAATRDFIHSIDILVNSAGITYPGRFIDLDQKIFKEIITTNYLGTVNLTKLAVKGMVERKDGTIINISSLAGLVGIFGYTAYTPSKFAIRGLSSSLRAELKPHGIDVHIVLPPDTDTPQLAFERRIMPETTKKINSSGGRLSADTVASAIIKGVNKNKYQIIPGVEGKILVMFAPVIEKILFKFAVREEKKHI
jgi:3-dehydrosphinganine reductase